MAKFGVGVGEEFPVDEPAPQTRDSERTCGSHGHWHRFGWLHFTLHVLFRLAIIALVIAAAVSLFLPHSYAPYGYYPYPHRFFFPFFPILLIVLFFALARRRGGCYGMRRHWHGEPRDNRREEG